MYPAEQNQLDLNLQWIKTDVNMKYSCCCSLSPFVNMWECLKDQLKPFVIIIFKWHLDLNRSQLSAEGATSIHTPDHLFITYYTAEGKVTRSSLNIQRAEEEHDTGRHLTSIITFSLVYIHLKATSRSFYTCHVFKVERTNQTEHWLWSRPSVSNIYRTVRRDSIVFWHEFLHAGLF